jgi:UDP-glucose 4-epimerase
MRVLVTGGAGFIGHHLVRALVDQEHEVVVLDDLSTGDRRRLAPYESRIRFIEGDVRDRATLRGALDGVEVVLHEAAVPSVARSIADPRRSNDVNVNGTVELVIGAAAAGVRRVVLAGSSSVYGSAGVLPRREDQPTDPRSPYAASKLAAEHYVHTIGSACGVESVVLRYFNVFGPGQDPLSEYAAVVPRFVTAALEGHRPVVFGDGTQSRDFTFIDNVVAANLAALVRPGVSGRTFNIGCGGRYTLRELLEAIGAATGRTIDPEFRPGRLGDVPHSQADISLAREHLGYDPAVDFAEGIRRSVAWYAEQAAGVDPTA